jgi:hypothetical protein
VRAKLGVPDAATVFLLVGSGYARKGVATAIAALARLPADTYLFVVGRDKARRRYKSLAQRLGVAQRVALLGPQEDVRPFYGAADAFVLPTLYDPCPNAALEAMACALPIVTSTKCGAAELVLEHDAGFVCAARDIDALAGHMTTLTDPQARAALGARAREAVLPLTPAAMTLQLALLYRDLLAAAYAAAPPSARAIIHALPDHASGGFHRHRPSPRDVQPAALSAVLRHVRPYWWARRRHTRHGVAAAGDTVMAYMVMLIIQNFRIRSGDDCGCRSPS